MFHCHPSTLTAAVALIAATFPCTSSQAQTSKVVPASAATSEGSTNSFLPFYFDAGHAQQVWLGAAVATGAAVLNSVNFRWDGANAGYASYSISKHVVTIGHTSVSPATMSTTFTANVTTSMTTVLNGSFSVAAAKPSIPAPFNINYPMSSPFIYATAKGNLLMEWIIGSGQATSKGGPVLDAVPATTGGGTVRPFGTWGKFSNNDTPRWATDPQKLVPGGTADILLMNFSQAYAAKLFVGLSDKTWNGLTLPYDLGAIGAPGNNLYTGLDVVVPFTLTLSNPNGYGANPTFPLPNDNKLIGVKAFIQSYYADAKANAAGLVTSTGMELTIGMAGPISKILGVDGTIATTGQYNTPPPVVQFVGAFN